MSISWKVADHLSLFRGMEFLGIVLYNGNLLPLHIDPCPFHFVVTLTKDNYRLFIHISISTEESFQQRKRSESKTNKKLNPREQNEENRPYMVKIHEDVIMRLIIMKNKRFQ